MGNLMSIFFPKAAAPAPLEQVVEEPPAAMVSRREEQILGWHSGKSLKIKPRKKPWHPKQ